MHNSRQNIFIIIFTGNKTIANTFDFILFSIYQAKLNKSILSESLRDSVEDNIACDTEKRTKQENRALKSTIDNMFNGQLAFQSKANVVFYRVSQRF
jgi:uncharacterized protein YaiL (DUF2058 family)